MILIFVIFAYFISFAMAQTTLNIPLYLWDGKEFIPIQKISQMYQFPKNERLPDSLIIESNDISYHKAYDDYTNNIPEKVQLLNKRVKKQYSLYMGEYPAELDQKGVKTCFRGKAEKLIDILDGIAGYLYYEDLVYLGWKIGDQTTISNFFAEDYASPQAANLYFNQFSSLWSGWSKNPLKNQAVLLMMGDEDNFYHHRISAIERCR